MTDPQHDVTRLLAEYRDGNRRALDDLLPLVYGELRRIAGNHLRRERGSHTLQPTALVHEAYMRLAHSGAPPLADRAHFFAIAARLMRQVLVDHARAHGREKRGGDLARVTLEDDALAGEARGVDLLALDAALTALAETDPRLCQVVELRYFGGLSIEETAEATGSSTATVKRDWAAAKTFLRRQLEGGGGTERGEEDR
jgi:RNA polymerase sigma factor (TIGR02999 family)